MSAEEKYIQSCYGNPADMFRMTMIKDGLELECHSSSEVCALIEDGFVRKENK